MTPDIISKVRFYRTEEGGRKGPTPPDKFGCLFELGGKYFDCRLILEATGSLHPGQSAVIPIEFLRPDLVKGHLAVYQSFHLCDGKIFADGEIQEIMK